MAAAVTASSAGGVGVGSVVAVMTTETIDAGVGVGVAANGREARNLAEKQRRDKLNASIQELATMVPHVAESTRRLDKTAVLRFATHGLRLQYVFGKSASRRRRKLCSGTKTGSDAAAAPMLTDTLMQLLDCFFLTLTCNGQIVLISSSVEQLLGHCQSDLYGQNILQITHPDDQALLRQQLIPRDIETLFYQQQQQQQATAGSDADGDGDVGIDAELDESMDGDEEEEEEAVHRFNYSTRPRSHAQLAHIDQRLRADRRCFTVRLARASTRAEATRHFEMVKIDGCFRRSDSSVTGSAAAHYPIVSQLIRRSRNNGMLAAAAAAAATSTSPSAAAATLPCLPQHDAIAQAALHGISGNDIVLVAMGRVLREETETSLLCRQPVSYQLEYRTRHLIDGSIIDCDQRIGLVAGYMKDEVRNLSPFSFMHQDDVRWVIVALRQMYDCNSDYGESCYRLLSRNGHFIYLKTKGFLEIDRSTNQVHSFLCVNTLLDEEDGKQQVQQMKNKFSTIIKAKIPTHSSPDLPASRNPQQLERIVLYLIENLQKGSDVGSDASSQPLDNLDDGYCSPASTATTLTLEELAPSPKPLAQLALVPPAAESVKHSISKSVNVVNVTAARNLYQKQQQQQQQQQKSQQQRGVIRQLSSCLSEASTSTSTLSPASSIEPTEDNNKHMNSNSNSNSPATTMPMTTPAATPTATLTAPSPPRASVLQKLPVAAAAAASAAVVAAAPAQLHAALSSTLRSLDSQLNTLGQEAQSLYRTQQRQALLPKFERQMDAIILEHQKQKELLGNIKSEYELQPSVITSTATVTATPGSGAGSGSGGGSGSPRSQQRRAL